jgi:hypothetical protein
MTVTTQQALTIGEAVRSKALGYAAKTGTAIDLVVVTGADAKDLYKLTPISLRAAIEANLSEEEIAALPLPGSRWNDGGEPNNNCDIFQWKDASKGPDAKPKEISFYVTWADGTPEGGNVCREIDWCKRVSQANMKVDDIPATWSDKYSNPQLIEDRLDYLEGRRNTIRGAYKEAVKLIWQMDAVNELKGCVATISDGGGTVLLEDRDQPKKNWKPYSVGAFLRLNAKQAQEQGGSYAALKATEKREAKTPDAKTTALSVNGIQTPETMDNAAVMLHSYTDKCMSNTGSADYALLLKHLTGDAGRQSILTLGDLKADLDKIFRMDAIRAVYDTEKAKIKAAA